MAIPADDTIPPDPFARLANFKDLCGDGKTPSDVKPSARFHAIEDHQGFHLVPTEDLQNPTNLSKEGQNILANAKPEEWKPVKVEVTGGKVKLHFEKNVKKNLKKNKQPIFVHGAGTKVALDPARISYGTLSKKEAREIHAIGLTALGLDPSFAKKEKAKGQKAHLTGKFFSDMTKKSLLQNVLFDKVASMRARLQMDKKALEKECQREAQADEKAAVDRRDKTEKQNKDQDHQKYLKDRKTADENQRRRNRDNAIRIDVENRPPRPSKKTKGDRK